MEGSTGTDGASARPTPLWPDNPTSFDLLGFADIAAPVIEAVGLERLDPVAVGVFGDWGSGKSTVLELISHDLDDDEKVITVLTRPWEYDPALDPKATLIAEVLGAVREKAEKDKDLWKKVGEKFTALSKRIQWSKAITLTTKSAITLSLPSFDNVVDVFSGDGGEDIDPTLQGFRDEFAALMTAMVDVERVVVLVDDLDRCLPDTVVATLEAIKLFLSVPKMAFVLAADRRLIEMAISERFAANQQATRMAREYLEKIVQIPVSVPALGFGDTEAYLSLLLLEHFYEGDNEPLTPIVEHCDQRRRAPQAKPFADFPGDMIPSDATDDLALAAMLAPVLFGRLDGNPRRLKRFLNAFWIRLAIARRRGAAPELDVLAKLMVLEQLEPDAFGQLLEWLREGSLPSKLKDLESGKLDNVDAAFVWWAEVKPHLAEHELAPYLRLAASLRQRPGPASDLRSDLADILESLQSPETARRSNAQKEFQALPTADRLVLTREVVNTMRVDPGSQEVFAETVPTLLEDAEVNDEFVDGLVQLNPSSIDAGFIVSLGGDSPVKAKALAAITEWIGTGRLGEIQARAAREMVGENS